MINYKGRSFIIIIIIIAISALALRIAIEQIIRISIEHNQSGAQSTLKLISAALENYAADNKSSYPQNLTVLTQTKPPYLEKNYFSQSSLGDYLRGYNYSCSRIDASGYNCSAIPIKCKLTGKMVYTVTTGGLLISEECEKKE
jgi:hypothetical protein